MYVCMYIYICIYICIFVCIPTQKKTFTYEAVTVTRRVQRKQKKKKEKNTFGTPQPPRNSSV